MKHTDTPDWLKPHLDSLPEELTPDRDLWPEIAYRLSHSAPRAWLPLALAATVLVSVLSAVLSWQMYARRPDPAPQVAGETQYRDLQAPFAMVRAGYQEHWPALREQMDPETAAVIERNMEIIRRASTEIEEALRERPGDPSLRRLMRQTLAKEADVYRRAFDAGRREI